MEFDSFAAKYPDEFTTLAPLLQLQKESNPQEINGNLRGAIKGRLMEVLGEDEGRYFLKALWGIERGSTTKLSQTQGNFLGMWLRTDGNEESLPGIVDAMRVFEAAQASEATSAERGAEAQGEMQRVAKEIGATVKELDEQTTGEIAISEITVVAKGLERTPQDRKSLSGLAEAPASVNFHTSLNGFNTQWTLRDWNEADLLIRVDLLVAGLTQLGAYPVDRYGNQIVTVNNESTIAEANQTPVTPQRAQPQRQAQTTTTADGRERFLVKEIVAQVVGTDNDKYAVRGGRYMKFGVTVWHEVAEQVHGLFDDVHLDGLVANEVWSAAGRNLFALAEKPEDKEFANKVVEFVVG